MFVFTSLLFSVGKKGKLIEGHTEYIRAPNFLTNLSKCFEVGVYGILALTELEFVQDQLEKYPHHLPDDFKEMALYCVRAVSRILINNLVLDNYLLYVYIFIYLFRLLKDQLDARDIPISCIR